MEKDFDAWNGEKKQIDMKEVSASFFFHEREIWWCSAGLNIGIEINGKHDNFERPVLIIKKFNREMVWALPMTTKGKDNDYHYKLEHDQIESWVAISQIKTLSSKRFLRKMGTVSEGDFAQIITRIKGFL
jgi:mRNA interferase MazF